MNEGKINILPFWLMVININLGVAMVILSGLAMFQNEFVLSIKLTLLSVVLLLLSGVLITNGITTRFFSRSLMILNVTSGSVILLLGTITLIFLQFEIDVSTILLVVGLIIHAGTRISISFSKLALPKKIKLFNFLAATVLIALSIVIITGLQRASETLLGITFLTVGMEKTFMGIQGYYME